MSLAQRVTAFVDWDTARRIVPIRGISTPRDVEAVFSKLQEAVARYLTAIDGKALFRVYWRIYHGWHRGRSKTPDRVLFERFAFNVGSRMVRNISFGGDYVCGDSLVCNSIRNPIYDTLRTDRDDGQPYQKMVDTLLVCDLLQLVRSRDSAVFVVIADDDDFAPALFTAEAWKAKVVMLHNRSSLNPHLSFKGIAERMVLS